MGNANTHGLDQRRVPGGERAGGYGAALPAHIPFDGGMASPPGPGATGGGSAAPTGGGGAGLSGHGHGSSGPVDITKETSKSPAKFTGSTFTKTVRNFRPRATSGDSSDQSARPRAMTVGNSHGPARHKNAASEHISKRRASVLNSDEGINKIDAETAAAFLASLKEDDGATKKLPTIFKYTGNARDVYVSGTFNNWQKIKMSKSTKDFVAIVDLKEGEHQYKFLVDGEWISSNTEPQVKSPDGSTLNNIIKVQKEDFDAYHALDMDSKAVALSQQNNKKRMFSDAFGQEIPQFSNVPGENRSGPPILPPHLLQVILNKDTPLSCEPTLLPEPNHVMLNHLYALSIKDGVMVLSSTQRYRRKYVTTLLYKPMGVRKG